jgi:hypothetical protein
MPILLSQLRKHKGKCPYDHIHLRTSPRKKKGNGKVTGL